jgi:hypothetical protein
MTFISREGRSCYVGQEVRVYVNLHKGGAFSIRDAATRKRSETGGLVLGYCELIALEGCILEVGEKARQRVVETGVKNVHAYVVGKIVTIGEDDAAFTEAISYNPLRCGYFYHKKDGSPAIKEDRLLLKNRQVFSPKNSF